MSDSRRDEPIAPRRTLKGPVLPPPAAGQADEARKAEEKEQARQERTAAKAAARERRSADSARRAEAKQARRDEQDSSAAAAGAGDQRPGGRPRRTSAERSGPRTQRSAPTVPAAAGGAAAGAAAATGTSSSRPQSTRDESTRDQSAGDQSAGRGSVRDQRSARPARSEGGGSRAARPARGGSGGSSKPAARRTRRAQLRLVQVDAWSVMKTSFLLSIALGIVLVVAVAVIWSVLGAAGVFTNINSVVQQAVGGESGSKFDITQYVGTSRIMGLTMIVAVIDVILITAIATLGAFLYNLSAALLGGIEVTLAEDN